MDEISAEYAKLSGYGKASNASDPANNTGAMTSSALLSMPRKLSLFNDESSFVTRYTPEFQNAFTAGTAIAWDVLFSPTLGGDFDPASDHLYVTAWNRATFGCEALLAYWSSGQAPYIAIYEHRLGDFVSRPGRPLSSLQEYVRAVSVGGYNLLSASIVNMSYMIDNLWYNEVYLAETDNAPPLNLYKSASGYVAAAEEQRGSAFGNEGAYGPSVEPSRAVLNPFRGINPVGWANTKLSSRDENGQWAPYQLLSVTQSNINPGSGGLRATFAIPNYTAVVVTINS